MVSSGRNFARNIAEFTESGLANIGIGDETIDSSSMPRLVADDRSGF